MQPSADPQQVRNGIDSRYYVELQTIRQMVPIHPSNATVNSSLNRARYDHR